PRRPASAARPGSVTARLLVCHGAMDPHVPMADVARFAEEMNRAGADWQLVMYGGAQHGFTHKLAAPAAAPGVAYPAPPHQRCFAAPQPVLARACVRGGQ